MQDVHSRRMLSMLPALEQEPATTKHQQPLWAQALLSLTCSLSSAIRCVMQESVKTKHPAAAV